MKKKMMTLALCSALVCSVDLVAVSSLDKNLFTASLVVSGAIIVTNLLLAGLPIRFPMTMPGGDTQLMRAVRNNYSLQAHLLLWCGVVSVDATDSSGKTALHYAVEHDNTEDSSMVQLLLNYGVNCNVADTNGQTPLQIVAGIGKLSQCEMLLGSGADINRADNSGVTPLMIAASSNNKTVCKMLLDSGANIYASDNTGQTLLILAAKHENKSMIKSLVRKGAICLTTTKMRQFNLSEEIQQFILDEYRLHLVKTVMPSIERLDGKNVPRDISHLIFNQVHSAAMDELGVRDEIKRELLKRRMEEAEDEIGGLC